MSLYIRNFTSKENKYDMKNYVELVGCCPPQPSASVDNTPSIYIILHTIKNDDCKNQGELILRPKRKEFLTVKSAGKDVGACIQTLDRTLNQMNFLFYEYGMKS
ncbi:unnamed protein product [Porites evermanni]|uniref:Uncharacterized protein n=1 Tax=Porites evermanni TaxID=104178 RepID=A0ABN8RTY7_9CNID|nr:unnamed protein product [Porites evermanni]